MELILIIASFASLAAIAGIVYPFKPFGKRRNALVALIACFVLIGVAAPKPQEGDNAVSDGAVAAKGEYLAVPSDPNAKYFVTEVGQRADGRVEIATRRDGPSGTSFAIRLVQCEPLRFGYIAEGDSKTDLIRDPSPELSELVAGSISDVVARRACERAGTSADELTEVQEDHGAEEREKLEDDVRSAVETLLWADAGDRYRTLANSGLLRDEFSDEIEGRMLELVRPLPASQRETNLKGYQFLAVVRPENPDYASKVEHYEEAIRTARSRAVSILRTKEDRVDGITWYQHPNQPRYLNSRSTAYLYIGKKDGRDRPWLRLKVQYTASDWLFVRRVNAWHDGIKEPLISGIFERDHNSTIWEWMDVSPEDYQIEVLRSLANADEAVLRFEGDQYRRDVTLSSGDKRALREILEAFEVMQSGM